MNTRILPLVLFICANLSAQISAPIQPPDTSGSVIVRFIPEPMLVPASVLASARDLGRWTVVLKNKTANTVTISYEDILLVSGEIRFLTPDDALLVLNSHVRRSTPQKLVTVISYLGRGAAIAVALASKSNYSWSAGIGIGTSFLPDILTLAQSAVPSVVPLISTVKWPVMLDPDCSVYDHWFSSKMKNPQPITVIVK